jgi:hypothetical protein
VDDLAKLDIEALAQRRFRFIKIKAETLLEGGETAMADREAVAAGAESIHGADGGAPAAQEGGDRLIRVNVPLLKRAMDRYEIDLIVEKIEREPDLLELLDHHIDYGQGYLFGEPRISREG